MKKLIYTLSFVFCLSLSATVYAYNGTVRSANEHSATRNNEREMLKRLHEIHQLTKTQQLSKDEKQKLRKEVLAIKKNYDRPGTYIYISGGALILIIILLIILL
ncbi:MAG: hypothetical protein JNL60_03880 [Bacteroidia bacterium]|nr:hypothetical protein [Bacteroidia bacterium]